jgi:predicted phage baseplate assembly protein
MPLVAPNLDDRRFQQLVDDAKRLVQQRCPEWTDHNVSDPGVTLIETFAWMTDLLLYRLNRVPDRHYIKFLELIGVQLYPATAARADVTFWLSGPTPERVRIPEGTEVATSRNDSGEPIGFTVADELLIVPCESQHLASSIAEGDIRDHDSTIATDGVFYPFDAVPKVGDTLYVGLSGAVPSCAVTLRFACEIDGIGVDPNNPPLAWEAFTADGWKHCDVERDTTGGLNRAGDVVVHVPKAHEVSVLNTVRGGWLRARIVAAGVDQPAYSSSPRIDSLRAFTIGGTTEVVNAEAIDDEIVGVSEGVPAQQFDLQRSPLVAGAPMIVEVASGDGWEEWQQVAGFAGSGSDDRHFSTDSASGTVVFGPSVTEVDGSIRQYGAVPVRGAMIRVRRYLVGGGRRGNVSKGRITILRSSIPFIQRIENRSSAFGGVDAETLDNAKVRGPITLRTRDRAVTFEDYEQLAHQAAPEFARVRAASADGSGIRVLVVPSVAAGEFGQIRFEQLVPDPEVLQRIAGYLDARRTVGARVSVEPPRYQGITVVARVRARPRFVPDELRQECLTALFNYFHPVIGGPDGDGWPFGRAIHVGDVYAVLQRLPGVAVIDDARLFAADPVTGERGQAVQRLDIDPEALVFSYEHQVLVEEA